MTLMESLSSLPDHQTVLKKAIEYFQKQSGVTGMFISGSLVSGQMDPYSDLDLGIVFSDTKARDQVWVRRWDWNIHDWFHRFDADHVKPYFVIYIFEPKVKADINLYLESDLPDGEGAPYKVVWDQSSKLGQWANSINLLSKKGPDWAEVVHEDERFWAWIFYTYLHTARGEYYDVAAAFGPYLRDIVEKWQARLSGQNKFQFRRVELREPEPFKTRIKLCFPNPSRESLKTAMLALIEIYREQHAEISRRLNPKWRTRFTSTKEIEDRVRSL